MHFWNPTNGHARPIVAGFCGFPVHDTCSERGLGHIQMPNTTLTLPVIQAVITQELRDDDSSGQHEGGRKSGSGIPTSGFRLDVDPSHFHTPAWHTWQLYPARMFNAIKNMTGPF